MRINIAQQYYELHELFEQQTRRRKNVKNECETKTPHS